MRVVLSCCRVVFRVCVLCKFCAKFILINGRFFSVFLFLVVFQVQQDGMSHGCIFARKFGAGTCPVNVWRTVCGVAAPAVDDQDTASALTTALTTALTSGAPLPSASNVTPES